MTDYPGGDAGQDMQNPAAAASAKGTPSVPPLPAFDTAAYRADVEALGLTDDHQRELLETLWSIMYSFVELGFSVDVCSAIFDNQEIIAGHGPETVKSLGEIFGENTIKDRGPT